MPLLKKSLLETCTLVIWRPRDVFSRADWVTSDPCVSHIQRVASPEMFVLTHGPDPLSVLSWMRSLWGQGCLQDGISLKSSWKYMLQWPFQSLAIIIADTQPRHGAGGCPYILLLLLNSGCCHHLCLADTHTDVQELNDLLQGPTGFCQNLCYQPGRNKDILKRHLRPSLWQTIETVGPRKWEFPQESHADWWKRLEAGARLRKSLSPRKSFHTILLDPLTGVTGTEIIVAGGLLPETSWFHIPLPLI